MTIKAQSRGRLQVETHNQYIKRDEYLLCATEGCQNVIAAWAVPRNQSPICSRCRHE